MIERITHLKINTILPKAPASGPRHRLEFLQRKDLYFSGHSTRAQLAHFLRHPDKPLMFSYTHSDTPMTRILGRFMPLNQRHVIMLTPMHPE